MPTVKTWEIDKTGIKIIHSQGVLKMSVLATMLWLKKIGAIQQFILRTDNRKLVRVQKTWENFEDYVVDFPLLKRSAELIVEDSVTN